MNLTDKEVVKALECCISSSTSLACFKCPMAKNKECNGSNTNINKLVVENALDLINRLQDERESLINGQETLQNTIVEQKAEIERLQKTKSAKCGTCAYAKPTTFGKSKCYVECTNKEHIEKFCRYRKISLKRQRTTPACIDYKELTESVNYGSSKTNHT